VGYSFKRRASARYILQVRLWGRKTGPIWFGYFRLRRRVTETLMALIRAEVITNVVILLAAGRGSTPGHLMAPIIDFAPFETLTNR